MNAMEIVRKLAGSDFIDDNEYGADCWFCGAHANGDYHFEPPVYTLETPHKADCLWAAAYDLVRRYNVN